MRNILKPAARTASSRARRSVRGVAAVVASVALAAGLGSYPVDAQETIAETTTSATAETAVSTTTAAETPTSSQASSEAPKPVVVGPNSVTVERDGDVDHITIRDTDDNPWDSGRKASDEYIWGVKRTGDGDITRIVKVVADGEELDPQYFGYVNGEDFDVIGIDEDAFWTIPPMKLEIEVETTEAGEYAIAEPDEVPTARELSETGYGRTDQAAATVNPEGVGMARAANMPESKERLTLTPLEYNANAATGGKAPKITLSTTVGGPVKEQKNVYLTEAVINYPQSSTYAFSGPVTIRKNSNESCTVQSGGIKKLSDRSVSVNLTGCQPRVAVWKGSGDRISVDFYGPGSRGGTGYSLELYGSYGSNPPQSETIPAGNPTAEKNFRQFPDRPYGECRSNNGVITGKSWWANTPGMGDSLDVVQLTLSGATDLANKVLTKDPRLKLRIGGDQSGWDELGTSDFDLYVEGDSLYFKLKTPQKRASFEIDAYDVWVYVPTTVTASGCSVELWNKGPEWYDRTAPELDLKKAETPRSELTWLPASEPNPDLPKKCVGDIALVIDTSDSVLNQNAVADSVQAALSVIDALQGTGSKMSIYNFASESGSVPGMTTEKKDLQKPEEVEALRDAVKAFETFEFQQWTRNGRGGTNYEAGLKQVPAGEYDVVYFITDGLPTTSDRDYPGAGLDVGELINQSDLARAVEQSNRLKASGTRVETVMVGFKPFNEHILKDDIFRRRLVLDSPDAWPRFGDFGYASHYGIGDSVLENLQGTDGRISLWDRTRLGTEYNVTNQPEIWRAGVRNTRSIAQDISGPDAVTTLENFGDLGKTLQELVLRNCFGSIKVTKIIHNTDGTQEAGVDWIFDSEVVGGRREIFDDPNPLTSKVQDKTDSEGTFNRKLDQSRGVGQTVQVVEHQQTGYALRKIDGKNSVCSSNVLVASPSGERWETRSATVTNVDDLSKPGFQVEVPFKGIVSCTIHNEVAQLDLSVMKVSYDGDRASLEGAQFNLYDVTSGQRKLIKEIRDSDTRVKGLIDGNSYELIETKAPQGYRLLTRSVLFTILRDSDGKAKIEFKEGPEEYPQVAIRAASGEIDHIIMEVADVRQGNLPKTGGVGIQIPALLGGALIAAGVLVGRRKTAA